MQGTTTYPTMTTADLCRLNVPGIAAPNSILLLWATWPKLQDALDVMKAWGFEYKTCYKLWRKVTNAGAPVMGCGWWTRGNSEMLLVGARGRKQASRVLRRNVRTEFTHPKTGRHSEKPVQIMADILVDIEATKRIDLFCRGAPHVGFDGWGLECKPYYFSRAASTSEAVPISTD